MRLKAFLLSGLLLGITLAWMSEAPAQFNQRGAWKNDAAVTSTAVDLSGIRDTVIQVIQDSSWDDIPDTIAAGKIITGELIYPQTDWEYIVNDSSGVKWYPDMEVYNGILYISVVTSSGGGAIWSWDGITLTQVKTWASMWAEVLFNYGGYLYAGMGDVSEGYIYRCTDPAGTWTEVHAPSVEDAIRWIVAYDDSLFAGAKDAGGSAYILSSKDGSSWAVSFDAATELGGTWRDSYSGIVHEGILVAAVTSNTTWNDNFIINDGTGWYDQGGLGRSAFSMVNYNDHLYIGTGESANEGDLARWNDITFAGIEAWVVNTSEERIKSLFEYKGILYLGFGPSATVGNSQIERLYPDERYSNTDVGPEITPPMCSAMIEYNDYLYVTLGHYSANSNNVLARWRDERNADWNAHKPTFGNSAQNINAQWTFWDSTVFKGGIRIDNSIKLAWSDAPSATPLVVFSNPYTPGSNTIYNLDLNFTEAAPDDNTSWFIHAEDNTAPRFIVYSDGDVVNDDNSYGAISDERLKENITKAEEVLGKVRALRVKQFTRIGDGGQHDVGLIAQDLLEIFPEYVKEIEYTQGEKVLTIEYSKFVPILIQAIQETNQRIDRLEEFHYQRAEEEGTLDGLINFFKQ